MLLVLYLIGLVSAGALAVVLLAWRLPTQRSDLSVAAMCMAATASVIATMVTNADHIVAFGASAGEVVDPSQKERMLGEAFSEGIPRLLLASPVLVLTTTWCMFAFRTRGARLATLAIGAVLLTPMAWLGTRGIGLHDRIIRETFLHVTSDSFAGCDALSDAVTMAGGMERAERYEPRSRRMAHECVASWLSAIDRGGDEGATLVALHRGRQEGATAFDWIERSGLLVDDAQRREVSRRKTLAL